jgi:hypothetical protein
MTHMSHHFFVRVAVFVVNFFAGSGCAVTATGFEGRDRSVVSAVDVFAEGWSEESIS